MFGPAESHELLVGHRLHVEPVGNLRVIVVVVRGRASVHRAEVVCIRGCHRGIRVAVGHAGVGFSMSAGRVEGGRVSRGARFCGFVELIEGVVRGFTGDCTGVVAAD